MWYCKNGEPIAIEFIINSYSTPKWFKGYGYVKNTFVKNGNTYISLDWIYVQCYDRKNKVFGFRQLVYDYCIVMNQYVLSDLYLERHPNYCTYPVLKFKSLRKSHKPLSTF